MNRFLIVCERAGSNYSAYCPDLPGCVATGRTIREARANMRSAIQFHIEGSRGEGSPALSMRASAAYVDIGGRPPA